MDSTKNQVAIIRDESHQSCLLYPLEVQLTNYYTGSHGNKKAFSELLKDCDKVNLMSFSIFLHGVLKFCTIL